MWLWGNKLDLLCCWVCSRQYQKGFRVSITFLSCRVKICCLKTRFLFDFPDRQDIWVSEIGLGRWSKNLMFRNPCPTAPKKQKLRWSVLVLLCSDHRGDKWSHSVYVLALIVPGCVVPTGPPSLCGSAILWLREPALVTFWGRRDMETMLIFKWLHS